MKVPMISWIETQACCPWPVIRRARSAASAVIAACTPPW